MDHGKETFMEQRSVEGGHMTVYQKLAYCQTKTKAPKDQFNSHSKFNYRKNEDILLAVKPHLEEVGAMIFQSDEIVQIGDRFYVKATSVFIDLDSSDTIEASAFAREAETKKGMDVAQVSGASSSYARKYSLNGLLALDDSDDPDSHNNKDQQQNSGARAGYNQNSYQKPQQQQRQPQQQGSGGQKPQPTREQLDKGIEFCVFQGYDGNTALNTISKKYFLTDQVAKYIHYEVEQKRRNNQNRGAQ